MGSPRAFHQRQYPFGGTGYKARLAGKQGAGVLHVEPVHILLWIDAGDHLVRVQMAGQGQLYQDTVDGIILVELPDLVQKRPFRKAGRIGILLRKDPQLRRPLSLEPYVKLGCGIFSHQDHCQLWRDPLGG